MTLEQIIERQAVGNFEKLIRRVSALESNDYYKPIYVEFAGFSNPPSQAQLNVLLGDPGDFNTEVVGMVKDTTYGNSWCAFSNKTDWYIWRVSNDDSWNLGLTTVSPSVVVTTNAAFTPGVITIASLPTTTTAINLSVSMNSAAVGTYVSVHKDIAGFVAGSTNLKVSTQVANVANFGCGLVPSDQNTILIYRSGVLTSVRIELSGFYI